MPGLRAEIWLSCRKRAVGFKQPYLGISWTELVML